VNSPDRKKPLQTGAACNLLIYLVRRGGLEPPRCYPLAPQASASANSAISALSASYFFGFGAGCVVFCCCCVTGAFRFSSTLPVLGDTRSARIASARDVIINKDAATVVAFDKTVAVPRGPNTV